ncbi:MAG: transcriptional regulator [Mariniphaga sp.]|nr:transcriptional regulator [Mariniphaga sp.]
METLKYKVIKTDNQYQDYCATLEELLNAEINNSSQDEVELLTLLIEKWDHEHNSFEDLNPIELLKSLMNEHKLKSKDLVEILGVSKGLVSDILNCKKGLSKEIIRTLSSHFSINQEAFNRSYKLKSPINAHLRNASVMNTCKILEAAQ